MANKDTIRSLPLQLFIVWMVLLAIPFGHEYYRHFFDSGRPFFVRLLSIVNYRPGWNVASSNTVAIFKPWLIIFAISILIAIVWNFSDKHFTKNKQSWKYYLWVFLRIRLSSLLIVYGLLLLFRLEAPYPTISELHTRYGYVLPWKIYYLSLGVSSAGYESTIGAIEILSALLLLFSRTSFLGAGLTVFLFINIVLANFAYHIGDQVLSVYILLLALAVLLYNFQSLYNLLVARKQSVPDSYFPNFSSSQNKLRILFKYIYILSTFILTLIVLNDKQNWPCPNKKGIEGIAGFYDVKVFNIDGVDYPYSQTDSVRWVDVVFEKWNTISIHYNKPAIINTERPGALFTDVNQTLNYENIGNGDRVFYQYEFDNSTLTLNNKNQSGQSFKLHISKGQTGDLTLTGTGFGGKHLQIQLHPVNKTYLLDEGRRKPVYVF